MKNKIFLIIGLCALLLTGCGKSEESITYNIGDSINFNPVTASTCLDGENDCMKFYVISDNEKEVNVILDHNTTGSVPWNIEGTNETIKDALDTLKSDTKSWNSSLNARLISANEVAKITNNESFDQATTNNEGWFYLDTNDYNLTKDNLNKSKYAWLYDNTNDCINYGCNVEDNSTWGYWTSSPVINNTYTAWIVNFSGGLFDYNVNKGLYGIRPVITISKSMLK